VGYHERVTRRQIAAPAIADRAAGGRDVVRTGCSLHVERQGTLAGSRRPSHKQSGELALGPLDAVPEDNYKEPRL
jgi:hypothetical protein